MILDRVFGFRTGVVAFRVIGGFSDLHEFGIEEPLLGLGVDVEEGRQTGPDLGQGVDVLRVDLLDDGEEATLLGVVVEDQLGDVHGAVRGKRGGSPALTRVAVRRSGQPAYFSMSSSEMSSFE